MNEKDSIKILNNLISTSEDGEKGFAEAAELAKDAELKRIFAELAGECASATRELRGQLTVLGAEAHEGGSVSGAAHRGWVKVKSAVEDSNLAVLEEVERGEDVAKAAYAKAVKAELPTAVMAIVRRQHDAVIRHHDRIRLLRDQYKAAH